MRVPGDCSFSAKQHAAANLSVSHAECCETPLLFGPSPEDPSPLTPSLGFPCDKTDPCKGSLFFKGEIYDAYLSPGCKQLDGWFGVCMEKTLGALYLFAELLQRLRAGGVEQVQHC